MRRLHYKNANRPMDVAFHLLILCLTRRTDSSLTHTNTGFQRLLVVPCVTKLAPCTIISFILYTTNTLTTTNSVKQAHRLYVSAHRNYTQFYPFCFSLPHNLFILCIEPEKNEHTQYVRLKWRFIQHSTQRELNRRMQRKVKCSIVTEAKAKNLIRQKNS